MTAVFVFDQEQDAVFRLEDRDGDGYMFASDEIAVFIDDSVPSTGVTNAQGLLAEGPHLLWATDNYDPTHIVRLEDLDGDGTALQSGESSVFFSGPLPGGFPFRNPTSVHRSPDGALYFTHNNVVSPTTISGIFRLQDLDGNGDANGADEATGLWELAGTASFGSSVSDMAVVDANTLFLIEHIGGGEATHLDRLDIEAGERDRFLDGDSLSLAQMLSLPSGSSAVGWLASTSEAVVQATGSDGRTVLIAARDDDGNGIADPTAEVRVLVDEQQHPQMAGAGFIEDFVVASDETLYWVTPEGGNVWAAYDEDGDGSYETIVRLYAPASSTAAVALQRPQSLAVFRGAASVSP